MALCGKDIVIQVSVDDATYYTVAELNEGSRSFTANNEDVTVFGQDWINRKQQLKDASYSLSGFTDLTDTNGQVAIFNSYINASALYVKVLFDGTNGYKQPVVVDSIEDSGDPSTPVGRSIEMSGNGDPTAVP